MTDPLEDRLRAHLADRAAQVTATPDTSAFVERSAGRRRAGAPLVAGAAALVALIVGGSFATGWSVAASGTPTTTAVPAASGSEVPAAHPTALAPGAAGADVSGSGAAVVAPLTSLFTRTTGSGVTIRTYTSTTVGVGGCAPPSPCLPIGSVPAPVSCPKGAMCAQPVATPVASPGSTPAGVPAPTGGSTGGTASGTSSSGGTTATVPPVLSGCQQLTVELSTAAAVGTATLAAPTTGALGPKSVEVAETGSFGEAEGDPVSWVAVVVSGDVASVRLESSTGVLLDSMTPSSGVAVLAATGGTALAGTSVVGVDGTGSAVATAATDGGASAAGPGCAAPTTTPPTTTPPATTPPTTTPGPTTNGPPTTGPVTTDPPTSTTTTTGPTSSTVVPGTASGSGAPAGSG